VKKPNKQNFGFPHRIGTIECAGFENSKPKNTISTMGQYCSSEDSYESGDTYSALITKFNARREAGTGAYGTSSTNNDGLTTAENVNTNDDWHLVSPSDNAMNNTTAYPDPHYVQGSQSPTKDDSTNSVMLYDIQYRMTNSHVVYVLHLKFRGIPNPGWTITKRFRQFNELHGRLQRTYVGQKFRKLPKLPPKQLFNNQKIARARQVTLGTYVRTLLAMELQSPYVADFLGIPAE